MTADKTADSALGTVLRLERDGAAFFRRANAIAADPRIRMVLERLARDREEGAKIVEDAVTKAAVHLPPGGDPTPYPFEAVAKVVCYACGYVADEIPESCPKCGAARYSFEKEFTKAMVWEIARSSGRAIVQAGEAAVAHAKGGVRSAIESVLRREQALTREAEGELASAKA